MPFHKEASVLQDADYGREGRLYRLAPPAATAWSELRPHAGRNGVENFLYSGFRSYEFQAELIRGRFARVQNIKEALSWLAA